MEHVLIVLGVTLGGERLHCDDVIDLVVLVRPLEHTNDCDA